MKEFLIVDGYNVINAWPQLKKLAAVSLDHAREKLLAVLVNYSGATGLQIIVVFDAHAVKGNGERREDYMGIQVLYSREGETADTVIERLSFVMRGERIYVVTSDWEEQRVVFGSGAYRISARQLLEEVRAAETEIASRTKSNFTGRTLESRLPEEIRDTMERWRRTK